VPTPRAAHAMAELILADVGSWAGLVMYGLFCLCMTLYLGLFFVPQSSGDSPCSILRKRVPMSGKLLDATGGSDARGVFEADEETVEDGVRAEGLMEHMLALLFTPFCLFAAWTASLKKVPAWAMAALPIFCIRGKLVDAALQRKSVWACFKSDATGWVFSTPSHCDDASHIIVTINLICKCKVALVQQHCVATWSAITISPITAPVVVGALTIGGCAAVALAMAMLWQIGLLLVPVKGELSMTFTPLPNFIGAVRIAGSGATIKSFCMEMAWFYGTYG